MTDGEPQLDLADAVLGALADFSPAAERRTDQLMVPLDWFRWLPLSATGLFSQPMPLEGPWGGQHRAMTGPTAQGIDRSLGDSLAAVDQVRPLAQSLRVGWLFLAGRDKGEKRGRRLFNPILSIPVRVHRTPVAGPAALAPAGDVQLTNLIPAGGERDRLEHDYEIGGGFFTGVDDVVVNEALLKRMSQLHRFAVEAAAAAGLRMKNLSTAGRHPLEYGDDVTVVVGCGVYVAHEVGGLSRAASLRAWQGRARTWSAFHTAYLGDPRPGPPATDAPLEVPYLLTPAQESAVRRARHQPISAISGAPGTGKSQTVVAIACDALARGDSVLVAARSDATVDALIDLFERAPGPDPVVFGSHERRMALSEKLETGGLASVAEKEVDRLRGELDRATLLRDRRRDERTDRLVAQQLTESQVELLLARDAAPGLFMPELDLGRLVELLGDQEPTGWWGRRKLRRAVRLSRASATTSRAELLRLAAVARAARRPATAPGEARQHEAAYDELLALDDRVRDLAARWLHALARSDERMDRAARGSLGTLATALRSGRAARREQLARLDRSLTRALPVWVGSLPDIEDLLPQVAALFDLVLIDEASSVEQPLAAPALLRARRAVVVGDPRQLRHVSFLADADKTATLTAHGLLDHPVLAARLDVRRNSLFDLAAAASEVVTLDEHYRCHPHLVDFVSRRIYRRSFSVATRSPATDTLDCIRVERVEGRRDKDGVVAAEVAAVVRELRALRAAGARSVGVLSPFRAQADALEDAVLKEFTVDDLEALDLRVGTVHTFQGNERDVVLVSIAVGPDDGAVSWRFVDDPHLFAVLSSRARRRVVLFLSADPPERGLLAGYLAEADSPPGRPAGAGVSDWASWVGQDLEAAGHDVVLGYPVGRHVVDVCVTDAPRPTAVLCGLHPDGPAAHIDRHLSLRRLGWTVHEMLPTPRHDHRAELLVELLGLLGGTDRR